MTVVVLYFAALRELLGLADEELSLPGSSLSVDELAKYLVKRHPALSAHLGSVRFAVNEAFVNGAAQVVSGDTVALIPPVSGG